MARTTMTTTTPTSKKTTSEQLVVTSMSLAQFISLDPYPFICIPLSLSIYYFLYTFILTSISAQLTLPLTHPTTSLALSKLTTNSMAHGKKCDRLTHPPSHTSSIIYRSLSFYPCTFCKLYKYFLGQFSICFIVPSTNKR